jgi:hypothetical protein
MIHGDIVVVDGRKAVALTVTAADIRNGVDVLKPGIYPFAGYWYGTTPLNHKSYGKILSGTPNERYRVIGRAHTHSQLVYLEI